MAPTEGKPNIRKKMSNRKNSNHKIDPLLQLRQQPITKSSSNKELKRSVNGSSSGNGLKVNRSKPMFEVYNSVPSGMLLDRGQQNAQMFGCGALSPKIMARKVPARRPTDQPTEQPSNDLRKKLLLNLSQTKSPLQRLVEQRHLARAYQLETRKYDTLVQSSNVKEIER